MGKIYHFCFKPWIFHSFGLIPEQMAAAAARRPLMASVKVIWNNHNTGYDLLQFMLRTCKCFHPNWKKHIRLGTGGLSNGTKPRFTVLHRSYCTFHNLILYLYRQNKTFQSAKSDFTAWKRKSDCAISVLLRIGFPLRRRLRPSDVNLCSDGSGK